MGYLSKAKQSNQTSKQICFHCLRKRECVWRRNGERESVCKLYCRIRDKVHALEAVGIELLCPVMILCVSHYQSIARGDRKIRFRHTPPHERWRASCWRRCYHWGGRVCGQGGKCR